MKLCVAQTRPVKGDIQQNREGHKKLIDLAISKGADLIIFPELSLTGYEPTLANDLATTIEDNRLDDFQKISDASRIIIGVGMPLKTHTGITISMILFQPNQARKTYSKKYIHADEEEFFISGQHSTTLLDAENKLALAICYEISVPEHAEAAFKNGAKIYIASVVKSVIGIDKALHRLSEIASTYSMTVLMCNSVGQADGEECAGRSSIWNTKGELLAQLDEISEGILIFDTDTQEVLEQQAKGDAQCT